MKAQDVTVDWLKSLDDQVQMIRLQRKVHDAKVLSPGF